MGFRRYGNHGTWQPCSLALSAWHHLDPHVKPRLPTTHIPRFARCSSRCCDSDTRPIQNSPWIDKLVRGSPGNLALDSSFTPFKRFITSVHIHGMQDESNSLLIVTALFHPRAEPVFPSRQPVMASAVFCSYAEVVRIDRVATDFCAE